MRVIYTKRSYHVMYMMEKEIRKINIDPELLKVTNNGGGTKRKQSTSEKSIRVRASVKPRDHNKTTKRNALLKFIRRHQANNSQQLLEGGDALSKIDVITSLPKNEIDETLEYLMSVADEVKKKEPPHVPNNQYTLKHDHKSSENVSMNFPGDLRSPSDHILKPEPSNIVLNHRHLVGGEHPKYGCLRNGELPTYRQLQKQNQPSHFPKGWSGANVQSPLQAKLAPDLVVKRHSAPCHSSNDRTNREHRSPPEQRLQGTEAPWPNFSGGRIGTKTGEVSSEEAFCPWPERENYIFSEGGNVKHNTESTTTKSSEKDPTNIQLKIMRQRRTSRRTFKIGKSKTRPKVGVLISNRTIRKNIATNALLLKQVPMTEIRRYLVKHNLITVGSNAPDYVLRKMYETSNTVCGEIFNHNNENLLHNFFHGKDEI